MKSRAGLKVERVKSSTFSLYIKKKAVPQGRLFFIEVSGVPMKRKANEKGLVGL